MNIKQEIVDDGCDDYALAEQTFFSWNVPGTGQRGIKTELTKEKGVASQGYQYAETSHESVMGEDMMYFKEENIDVLCIKNEPEDEHFEEAQVFDAAQFSTIEGDQYGYFQGNQRHQGPGNGQDQYYGQAEEITLICKEEIDQQCETMLHDETVFSSAEDSELVQGKSRDRSACKHSDQLYGRNSQDCKKTETAKGGIEGPPMNCTTVRMTTPNSVFDTLNNSDTSTKSMNRSRERDEPRMFSGEDFIHNRNWRDHMPSESSCRTMRSENVPPIACAKEETYYQNPEGTEILPIGIATNPYSRMGKSTRAKSPKCSLCNLNFYQDLDLTGKKPYHCPNCDTRFSLKKIPDVHSKADTEEKPHRCSQCSKRFVLKNSLNVHLRTHTGEKHYQCSVCNKWLSQSSSLSRHMRTHTGEKPYQCLQCDKMFALKKTLNEHLKTHTGEKPYKCSHCDDNFACKNTLDVHLRTHTGEKPYQCSVCSKWFSQSSSLSLHMRTHTGEKPYQCSQCDKRFALKNTLDVHLRTHRGENPYQCSVCNKNFSQYSSRRTHENAHSRKALSTLSHCDDKFACKNTIDVHLRTHTGEKP